MAHDTDAHIAGGPIKQPESSLLERDAAIDALTSAIASACRGEGQALFLAGTAGMGKTSLLALAADAAQAQGFSVARAVGSPTESGLPFGLLGQAMLALGGPAGEDADELERLGGPSARMYRTLRFLTRKAQRAPLLLAVDDLHWSDADSLELLGFVCRRMAGTAMLVLGTLRPEPDAARWLARELVGAGQASMLALEPLTRGAAETLLADRVELDAGERDRVVEACAGSPLLLNVAAATLGGGGSLPAERSHGRFGSSLLLERFVGLGDDAYGYVLAAAILGVRFKAAIAGRLAGLEQATWEAAHQRLVRSRLLDDLGSGWAAFVHPLFAQALEDSLSTSERERAHVRAFRLMVEHGEPDAIAAEHATAARLVGDPLAVAVAARAGRAALGQGALEAAVSHLGAAVAGAGERPDPGLLLDYAAALAARARVEDARAVCDSLLSRGDVEPAVRARALSLLGRAAVVIGRPAEAESVYAEAVAAAARVGPDFEAAMLVDAAVTCHVGSPSPWVTATTSRALDLLPAGAPLRARMEFLLAYFQLMQGDPSGVPLLKREIGRWSARTDRDDGWGWTMAVHALNTFKLLEDPAGATELFEREFENAIQDGAPLLINALTVAYADAVQRIGRPREALELVQRAMAVSAVPMSPWMELAQAVLLTELGRDADARIQLELMYRFVEGVPPEYFAPVRLWTDLIEARVMLERGEAARASRTMLHAAWIARVTGWLEPCIVPWAGVAFDAHIAAGRIDRARAVLANLERLSQPLACLWPRAVLELGRAGIAAAEHRHDDADGHFARGLAIFDQLPFPIGRADALVSYGAYLRRSGRPREARVPLARALELAQQTESARVFRIARAELAASGGRRRRRIEHSGALTPQEQRVADLAADGMSNAQIATALTVSAKTVDNHLQQVYAKLGIHSRRELMRRSPEAVE